MSHSQTSLDCGHGALLHRGRWGPVPGTRVVALTAEENRESGAGQVCGAAGEVARAGRAALRQGNRRYRGTLHVLPESQILANRHDAVALARLLGVRSRLDEMGEWWSQNAVSATAVLISIASLLGTILYRRRSERKREFELLLQRFDREAAKREAAIDQEAKKREAVIDQEAKKREAAINREAAKRDERFEREAAKRDKRFDQEAAKREAAIDREAAKRQSAFEAALQRFDQEAAKRDERFEREVAKREAAIQAAMDRSDRKFEAVQARSDELSRQLAQLVERVVTNEASLDEVRAAVRRMVSNPVSTPRGGETLAAQEVPD